METVFRNFYFVASKVSGSVFRFEQTGNMQNQNKNSSRITVTQARKALGMVARNYSDTQIEEIIMLLYEAAEFTYELYQRGD